MKSNMKMTLLKPRCTLAFSGAALANPNPDQKTLILKNKDGAAILGYEPRGRIMPTITREGQPQVKIELRRARDYYFVSAGHKRYFDANTAKYAPAYGGYCGYAASIDRFCRPISPSGFRFLMGASCYSTTRKAFDKFNAELKENVVKADQNWPGLVCPQRFGW